MLKLQKICEIFDKYIETDHLDDGAFKRKGAARVKCSKYVNIQQFGIIISH